MLGFALAAGSPLFIELGVLLDIFVGVFVMGIMMLAASKGTDIIIHAEGDDDEAAIEKLETLIKERFGEDE